MIRRLFWMSVGAGLGISGYRRTTRVFRELTAPAARSRRTARRMRGLAGFVRDVRDGVELYEERRRDARPQREPAGPTLGLHQVSSAEAGPNGSAAY